MAVAVYPYVHPTIRIGIPRLIPPPPKVYLRRMVSIAHDRIPIIMKLSRPHTWSGPLSFVCVSYSKYLICAPIRCYHLQLLRTPCKSHH